MAGPNDTAGLLDNVTWELDSFVTPNVLQSTPGVPGLFVTPNAVLSTPGIPAEPPGVAVDPLQLGAEAWAVPLVFSIITLVGVTGNGLVIYVIARYGQMKTVTNYYLLNLAVVDLYGQMKTVTNYYLLNLAVVDLYGQMKTVTNYYLLNLAVVDLYGQMKTVTNYYLLNLAVVDLYGQMKTVTNYYLLNLAVVDLYGQMKTVMNYYLLNLAVVDLYGQMKTVTNYYLLNLAVVDLYGQMKTVTNYYLLNLAVVDLYGQMKTVTNYYLLNLAVVDLYGQMKTVTNYYLLNLAVVDLYGQMKTVTNYYLLNLAVVDLSFLVCCVPFTAIIFATNDWMFGKFMCKFVFYFMQPKGLDLSAESLERLVLKLVPGFGVGSIPGLGLSYFLQCSSRRTWEYWLSAAPGMSNLEDSRRLTLAALSLDRYYAIIHPIGSMYYRTPRTAFLVNTVVWAAAFVLASPVAVAYQQWEGNFQGPRTYCTDQWSNQYWRKAYWVMMVVLCFVIPLAVCTFTSAHVFHRLWKKTTIQPLVTTNQHRALMRKRKVCRMVVAVVVIFTICWAPNHIINLWVLLDNNFPETWVMFGVKVAALCLSYANSSINPLIYAFMGENFRKRFKKAFPKVFHSNRVIPLGAARSARHVMPVIQGVANGNGFLQPPEACALIGEAERASSKDDHADIKGTKSDRVEVISIEPVHRQPDTMQETERDKTNFVSRRLLKAERAKDEPNNINLVLLCSKSEQESVIFDAIQTVHTLRLRQNLISEFSWESLRHVKYLTDLDLSYNLLTSVRLDLAISGLKHLIHVDLAHNKLATFSGTDLGTHGPGRTRRNIFIQGNPIHCDCHMKWLATLSRLYDDCWPSVISSKSTRCRNSLQSSAFRFCSAEIAGCTQKAEPTTAGMCPAAARHCACVSLSHSQTATTAQRVAVSDKCSPVASSFSYPQSRERRALDSKTSPE
ncbi:receptor [Branchiostoma belcheri]|nr:receptor [Branchiostoma belcheri]